MSRNAITGPIGGFAHGSLGLVGLWYFADPAILRSSLNNQTLPSVSYQRLPLLRGSANCFCFASLNSPEGYRHGRPQRHLLHI